MNKKRIAILGISLTLILVIILVTVIVVPKLDNRIPLKIKLDLEFQNEDDLNWLRLGTVDGSDGVDYQLTMQEGYIRLGGDNTYNHLDLVYSLEPNQFIHIRTRSSENLCAAVGLDQSFPGQSKALSIGGCDNNLYNAEVSHNRYYEEDSVSSRLPMYGSVPSTPETWVDRIIWLNEGGDQVYFMITNTNDPVHVMYSSFALPEDWLTDRWGIGVSAFYDLQMSPRPYIDVDLIRGGSGKIQDYLSEYVPAYKENKDEIDKFLNQPAAEMPELLPPQQTQPEMQDDNSDTSESSLGGQENSEESVASIEEEAWDGVLTWPDPQTILPYLAAPDDMAFCPTCDNTVYGVSMTPFGYVYSVSYGPPADTPANFFPCVKQWVQLYDRPISKEEFFYFYKTFARIKQNGADEPFQVLYNNGGIEANLMTIVSNVVINGSAANTGNDYTDVMELVKKITRSLPEEGLQIPDMVPTPSTVLNASLADQVLEKVWLASHNEPDQLLDSLHERETLYFQLKEPVNKIEGAIYHLDTQTYLSYFWMDNPGVDKVLPLSSCIINGNVEYPNTYYTEKIEGNYLIRIWADGELISEFEVEG